MEKSNRVFRYPSCTFVQPTQPVRPLKHHPLLPLCGKSLQGQRNDLYVDSMLSLVSHLEGQCPLVRKCLPASAACHPLPASERDRIGTCQCRMQKIQGTNGHSWLDAAQHTGQIQRKSYCQLDAEVFFYQNIFRCCHHGVESPPTIFCQCMLTVSDRRGYVQRWMTRVLQRTNFSTASRLTGCNSNRIYFFHQWSRFDEEGCI